MRVQLFGVVGFDAVAFQLRAQLGEVLVVPRLNGAENIHRRNIRGGERAIVHDLLNAGAG